MFLTPDRSSEDVDRVVHEYTHFVAAAVVVGGFLRHAQNRAAQFHAKVFRRTALHDVFDLVEDLTLGAATAGVGASNERPAFQLPALDQRGGTVAITEEQTMGKGRRGRSWLAEAGAGIAMSFLLKPQIEAQNSSMITLVTALAVNEAICETTGIRAKIKWPNDIVSAGAKLAGILLEREGDAVIIGFGINLAHHPEGLGRATTSM